MTSCQSNGYKLKKSFCDEKQISTIFSQTQCNCDKSLNKIVLSTVDNGAIFMNKDCPKCGGLFFFGGAIGFCDNLYFIHLSKQFGSAPFGLNQ